MIEYNPLAFTSPETNTRSEFTYSGSMQDETSHNLGEFSFSGADGKHYQDKSLSTGNFQFTIFAKNEDALREIRSLFSEKSTPASTGTLEHPDPTMGSFPVVISSFSVNQNSVKGQGFATIQVTFFKTIPNLLSGNTFAQENPASAQSTLTAINELNAIQANDLKNSVDLSTGAGFAAFVQSTISMANSAKANLDGIAQQLDEISIAFTDAYLDIINNVETYAKTPFSLARKIQNFIQLPMLAISSVNDRTAAYKNMLSENEDFSTETLSEITAGSPAGKTTLANKAVASLAAISAINYTAVSGQSVSIDKLRAGEPFEDTGYLSREQISDTINLTQETARTTTDLFSLLASQFEADTFFSQYFDYSILNKAIIASVVQNLNNRIFASAIEQSITVTRDITPIELCSDLYQSVEISTIEFLLASNKLNGNSIFLIPKGKEIKFY